jgi:molybdate transport system substrate-binding protein
MNPILPTILRRTFLGLVLSAGLAAGPALAAGQTVTVFAAASLKNALDDVGAAYAAKTGNKAVMSYGASSALARQIEQGAPADVYVSADSDWMDYVAQKMLIVSGSRTDLLTNHLALIAPAASSVKLKIGPNMPIAAALGDGKLSMAGASVPAGKYGEASLRSLGVWDSVKDHVAPAENVRAALAFVAQGEAPLGIVYDTDAKVEPKVKIVGLFPDASHPKIVYPGAVVAASKNPEAAAFLTFLKGAEASAVFKKYGFIVLK